MLYISLNMIYHVVIYILTFISAIIFRKNEQVVAIFHFFLMVMMCLLHINRIGIIILCICLGIIMTIAEYICVRFFGMWKYSNTTNTLPFWLVFTWILVAFFFYDVHKYFSKFF
jgi:hypothetical protein